MQVVETPGDAEFLPRERLIAALGRGASGLRLVIGPSGTGKTTVVDQWAGSLDGPSWWITPDRVPTREAFHEHLEAHPLTRAVVFEDVDELAPPALRRLEVLVASAAPHRAVVVTSRHPPALDLVRRDLRPLAAVTATDLAFRPWETLSLFTTVYGVPLSATESIDLTRRTAGWAAALRLWHVSAQLDPDLLRRGRTARLPPLVANHVARQLADVVDPQALKVLLRMSVLDVVSPERAEHLLGADSGIVLESLADRVDLMRKRPDGVSHGFHPLLREHLLEEARLRWGPAALRAAHGEAGVALESLGLADEAFLAFCRAERLHRAAALADRVTSTPTALMRARGLECVTATLAQRDPALARARTRLLDADRVGVTDSLPPAAHATGAAQSLLTDILRGRLDTLRALGQREVPGADDDPWTLGARATVSTMRALVTRDEVSTALDETFRLAEQHGMRWLERVLTGVVLAARPGATREAALVLAQRRRTAGDQWGAVLVEVAAAVASCRQGQADAEPLEALAAACRRLGASGLEVWVRAAHALVAAETDQPDSSALESAEALARAAMAPAPLALALAARARTGALREREARALQHLAHLEAVTAGLTVRPWTWVRDSPRSRAGSSHHASSDVALRRPGRSSPAASDADATLRITCFKDFTVSVGGTPVDLASVRPVALTVLRVLAAAAGSPVHRDELTLALWPGLSETAARHNLHVAVSSLRAGLDGTRASGGRQTLTRQGQAYVLRSTRGPLTDLESFDAALDTSVHARHAGDQRAQAESLELALDLYRGEVLPGDGSADWAVEVRDRYRQRAATAAVTWSTLALRRGDPTAAVRAALRSTEVDPWSDGGWQALITALDRAERPGEAARARADYAARLASLGVAETVVPLAPAPHPGGAHARVKNAASASATRRVGAAPTTEAMLRRTLATSLTPTSRSWGPGES